MHCSQQYINLVLLTYELGYDEHEYNGCGEHQFIFRLPETTGLSAAMSLVPRILLGTVRTWYRHQLYTINDKPCICGSLTAISGEY